MFELGWQTKGIMSEPCVRWVTHAIEAEVMESQRFSMEQLDGVELQVESLSRLQKPIKYSFLDIEIDPLAFSTMVEPEQLQSA